MLFYFVAREGAFSRFIGKIVAGILFKRTSTMVSKKTYWRDYYTKLTELYKLIESENSSVLYQSMESPLFSDTGVDARYRAIIRINDNDVLDKLTLLIEEAKILFLNMVGSSNNRLPSNLPKILVDDNVFKIQVHINIAHSSKNYTTEDLVFVAKHYGIDASQKKSLEEQGYRVVLEKEDNKKDERGLYLDIKKLCELYKCQSIQHRIKSGQQTRANFFTYAEDGSVERSVLKSVGVLLLKPHQEVEVMRSHDRKIRTDAIYAEKHPDEIELHPIVNKNIFKGRIYKRFTL